VFGANTNAFSSRFSEFSICHPIYHENTMLLATRHAIYSAAVSTEETATFMLLSHYWSEHPRDKVFGANTNAFSSRFSGFSICHPIYHENIMLLATRPAIYSAAVSTEETATFMLLPSWNTDMTTTPFASLYHSAASTHTCVNSWAPSHQTNSNMRKCPSGKTYKYHFPNTPGNCRSLPYGTLRAGSASMLTTNSGFKNLPKRSPRQSGRFKTSIIIPTKQP